MGRTSPVGHSDRRRSSACVGRVRDGHTRDERRGAHRRSMAGSRGSGTCPRRHVRSRSLGLLDGLRRTRLHQLCSRRGLHVGGHGGLLRRRLLVGDTPLGHQLRSVDHCGPHLIDPDRDSGGCDCGASCIPAAPDRAPHDPSHHFDRYRVLSPIHVRWALRCRGQELSPSARLPEEPGRTLWRKRGGDQAGCDSGGLGCYGRSVPVRGEDQGRPRDQSRRRGQRDRSTYGDRCEPYHRCHVCGRRRHGGRGSHALGHAVSWRVVHYGVSSRDQSLHSRGPRWYRQSGGVPWLAGCCSGCSKEWVHNSC